MNTIDKILIGCAVFLGLFTLTMIILYCVFQSVPDTLIECVFQLFTGEIFLTFAIWWIKKKAARKETKENEG
jgi:putative Ca2+/H+ antiporter (TMEM165/GDT1 family)